MNTTAMTPTEISADTLIGGEQQDFALIMSNARSMGWLPAGGTIHAYRDDEGVLVRINSANSSRERHYPDGQRWLLQLLHELAQGLWKL